MNFELNGTFGNINFDELRSDEIEIVSGGSGSSTTGYLAMTGALIGLGGVFYGGAAAGSAYLGGAALMSAAVLNPIGIATVGAVAAIGSAYAYFG